MYCQGLLENLKFRICMLSTKNTDSSAQYVEYKEPTENVEVSQLPRKMLVSETWAKQEMFGISLALRKKKRLGSQFYIGTRYSNLRCVCR